MDPQVIAVLEKLLSIGGQAGILLVATYYLARVLKAQYDERITDLEKRSEQCELHRIELGKELRAIQNDRISILEKALERAELKNHE